MLKNDAQLMKLYLQGILFTRAQQFATRRGFSDDKERAALVDGWLAGFASGKRKDVRIERLIEQLIADGSKNDGQRSAIDVDSVTHSRTKPV